jgi:hypothetical protein
LWLIVTVGARPLTPAIITVAEAVEAGLGFDRSLGEELYLRPGQARPGAGPR